MMLFFDHFVDTREKRYHLLLILLLGIGIWMLSTYVVVGYQLVKLHSYSDLFALLDTSYIEFTYISRIIVDAISITKFTLPNVLACFINNLSVVEVMALLCSFICLGILEKKRVTSVVLLLMVIEVFASCGIALLALQAQTLGAVIQYIQIIGIVILCITCILFVLFVYHILRQIRYYYQALQFVVYEEKEHMAD